MGRKASQRKQQRKRAGRGGRPESSNRLSRGAPSLPSARPRRDLTFFGLLLLLLFVIYNSNFRSTRSEDTLPARYLPFSLLLDHNIYLDQWIQPRIRGPEDQPYFVHKPHDHWISSYPIILPVLITPLYVLPAWWLSRQSPPLYPHSFIFNVIVNTMEKLSASLIAALSGAVLFLALRKVASRNVSLGVALIYGLASNTWAISSQALWRQGLTELSFTFLLWALLRLPDSPYAPSWAGIALGVAAANKPLEGILILALLVYFAGHRQWKNLLLFLAPLAVLGLPVLAFNLHFFVSFLGVYSVRTLAMEGGLHSPFVTRLVAGLLGTMVSPSRGALIYMPWIAFALWGAARLWKDNNPGWSRPLIVAVAAIHVVQVGGIDWWGGWNFGPRYFTDLLPFFAWFLVPVWASIGLALCCGWCSLRPWPLPCGCKW